MAMEPPPKPSQATLFQVYLRLRPPIVGQRTIPSSQPTYPQLPTPGRFINVEPESPISETFNPDADGRPTHITLNPPNDSRKRAVEKFAFTKVFEEHTSQLDVFHDTRAVELVEGVLDEGRDGLLATLGVTGSGKVRSMALGQVGTKIDNRR